MAKRAADAAVRCPDSAGECYAVAHDQPYDPHGCQRACECSCHALAERCSPDFGGAFVVLKQFEQELRAEIEWVYNLHRRDKTGQAKADQAQLRGLVVAVENLAAAVKRVANDLGFGFGEKGGK